MKTIIKLVFTLLMVSGLSGCSEDDEGPGSNIDDDGPVGEFATTVKFEDNFNIDENGGARDVKIQFDRPAINAGEIKVRLHLQEGLVLQTVPEAIDNLISLDIQEGDESISFSVEPADDDVIKGMKNLNITFFSISEGFRKAHNNGLSIIVIDDELKGKPKSMHNGAITYHYREDGKIRKVDYLYEGTVISEIYHYTEDDYLQRIENSWGYDHLYFWEGQKVIRSETKNGDEVQSYSLYKFDKDANISQQLQYTKQNNGEFEVYMKYEYEYFPDGNLHKILMYGPLEDKSGYQLGGTYTYDDYSDKLNLWPINEIVPTIPVHKNLYGSLNSQDGWGNESNQYTYEFNADGQPIKQLRNGITVMTFEYY